MSCHLFSAEGRRAIADSVRRRPLLAFDFDGTLAPIVVQPDQAYPDPAVAQAMSRLCELAPVAVVTGRSIADTGRRLGFQPRHIVGNHGAEGLAGQYGGVQQQVPQSWRDALAALMPDFNAFGIAVEDKGLSLSLHYRQAADPVQARRIVDAAVLALRPPARVVGGKCLVNVLPEGAPDKYVAIRGLIDIERCGTAIFIGDDLTDDIVFERAPSEWLTIRVEPGEHTKARFFLPAQRDVRDFIQRLIEEFMQLAQASPPRAGLPP